MVMIFLNTLRDYDELLNELKQLRSISSLYSEAMSVILHGVYDKAENKDDVMFMLNYYIDMLICELKAFYRSVEVDPAYLSDSTDLLRAELNSCFFSFAQMCYDKKGNMVIPLTHHIFASKQGRCGKSACHIAPPLRKGRGLGRPLPRTLNYGYQILVC